jgi:hypothetical protein
MGVTDRLDVGVAVPIIRASLEGTTNAIFDSFTLAHIDTARHFFGNGTLVYRQEFENTASGIGDVSLRAKYNFHRGEAVDVGAFADVRVPTGDEENFLGSGDPNVRGQLILSWSAGNINPHVNAGFQYRGSDADPNEMELILGFDTKLTERLTFAADFTGAYEVGGDEERVEFPAPIVIKGDLGGELPIPLVKVVEPTNIPNRVDNLNSGSFGVKWSPRERFLLLANAIVSLNHGGLRDNVVPTFGLEYNF